MITLDNDNLLTIEETAKIFKTQISTVRTWIRRKQLPPDLVFRIGGIVRVRKPLLEKFIKGEL
ncbi:MAG: helix-turn-helix domain-containing protein [Cyanobacteria bacterium SIG31]|nr:helix-turn-helix domain-containing protein [Cyanobacteria bacterium SIG31]